MTPTEVEIAERAAAQLISNPATRHLVAGEIISALRAAGHLREFGTVEISRGAAYRLVREHEGVRLTPYERFRAWNEVARAVLSSKEDQRHDAD